MAESFKQRVTKLTDPRALRAYAHPTRMALVGLLRREGPLTATRAAELTGESVASCSYHLRQLAKHGLVEEDEGGQGREKPWRATARFTEWPEHSDDPAVSAAADAVTMSAAEAYFEQLTRWVEDRADEPREWQEATQIGDQILYLTAAELTELGERMRELITPYEGRWDDPERRPRGARQVSIIRMAFPTRDRRPRGTTGPRDQE
jgi:DNA-binding transcriptional ArsR family regulator